MADPRQYPGGEQMRKKRLEKWFVGEHTDHLGTEEAKQLEQLFLKGQELMRERIQKAVPQEMLDWETWLKSPSRWGTTGSPGRTDTNTAEGPALSQGFKDLGWTKWGGRLTVDPRLGCDTRLAAGDGRLEAALPTFVHQAGVLEVARDTAFRVAAVLARELGLPELVQQSPEVQKLRRVPARIYGVW